jgi:ketosteroid isomerase-like protein
MIASMLAKKTVHSGFGLMSQDDYDVNALMASWAEDAVWDGTSELGVGETLKGKKAIAEWFERWKKEFPKRKFVVKNVCMRGTFLPSPTNICMVEWTCWQKDKQGKEFEYDGVSVLHVKNMKAVHVSEYISFKGLPRLSNLIKPLNKA